MQEKQGQGLSQPRSALSQLHNEMWVLFFFFWKTEFWESAWQWAVQTALCQLWAVYSLQNCPDAPHGIKMQT